MYISNSQNYKYQESSFNGVFRIRKPDKLPEHLGNLATDSLPVALGSSGLALSGALGASGVASIAENTLYSSYDCQSIHDSVEQSTKTGLFGRFYQWFEGAGFLDFLKGSGNLLYGTISTAVPSAASAMAAPAIIEKVPDADENIPS